MSLESWKAEFYPVPAKQCEVKDSVQHALTKWKGLLPDNCERHEVILYHTVLILIASIDEAHRLRLSIGDIRGFDIGSDNCPLCIHYKGCRSCPITKSRTGVNRTGAQCDRALPSEAISPWGAFLRHNNPRPMISCLESTLEFEKHALLESQALIQANITIGTV
jgi:hypothetical protein